LTNIGDDARGIGIFFTYAPVSRQQQGSLWFSGTNQLNRF